MTTFRASVAHWPLDRLIPQARNSRTHSEAQVGQIAASIGQFGFVNPVLVGKDGVIVAGHGRVLAAAKLGRAEVPVIVLDHLSETQRRALTIADNKLALNAGWDEALLNAEIADLKAADFNIDLLGFDDDELAALIAGQKVGLTDPDETPEPPAVPVTRLGDVWTMGGHRIVCGDCTDAAVVERCLNGARPHLMVTDPPYGVEYDPKWRADAGVNRNTAKMGAVLNDDRADWREAWALFPGDVAYLWHGALSTGLVGDSLIACGFALRSQIIWGKVGFPMSRGNYHWQHEPCWYAVREGKTGHWAADRKQSTLWVINAREDSGMGHSTQKPVECMRRPIENNSKAGDAVYEPFSGSGTTIIAAEITGRRCHAIELNPAYVDVAIIRWQEFTGETAMRESDGLSFDKAAKKPRAKAA